MENDIKGVGGELAFCRMLGLSLDRIMDTSPNWVLKDKQDCILPDGRTVDVKTTSGGKTSKHLNVEPWKQRNPAAVYVSMCRTGKAFFTFRGAALSEDVFHPMFSPFVDGIKPGTDPNSGLGHVSVCYRVPLDFLGGLPDPLSDSKYKVPHTGKDLRAMFLGPSDAPATLLPKATRDLLPHGLSSPMVVEAIGKELDADICPQTMTMREWWDLCRTGLVPRWADGMESLLF